MKNLGAFLKALREKKNLTLRQAGELAGMDPTHISRTENGRRNISPTHLRRLLFALGVSAGSVGYVEAFALQAADASLIGDAGGKSDANFAKRITQTRAANNDQESRLLEAFRALSPDRREALLFALHFPEALDGVAAISKAASTAYRNKKG